jgi:hypothetical protein
MIGRTATFLRKQLDAYLRAELGGVDDPIADKVVFLESDRAEPISFKEEAVSELLIHVGEERLLRAADPYVRVHEDGRPRRVQPDLRLVLHVLFVARFKQYDAAWEHLAKVIEYLQSHRTVDHSSNPELPAELEMLTFELISQPLSEQGTLWAMLRTSYLPSVLYRVGLVVLRDPKPVVQDQITQPLTLNIHSTR